MLKASSGSSVSAMQELAKAPSMSAVQDLVKAPSMSETAVQELVKAPSLSKAPSSMTSTSIGNRRICHYFSFSTCSQKCDHGSTLFHANELVVYLAQERNGIAQATLSHRPDRPQVCHPKFVWPQDLCNIRHDQDVHRPSSFAENSRKEEAQGILCTYAINHDSASV